MICKDITVIRKDSARRHAKSSERSKGKHPPRSEFDARVRGEKVEATGRRFCPFLKFYDSDNYY